MNVLFLHQAFPAQFGRLAQELTQRHGWRCQFLIDHLSRCPSPSREMLDSVEIHQFPGANERVGASPAPWPQVYGRWLDLCTAARRGLESLPGPPPDLIVAHGGQGAPILFLKDVCPAPIINYCEYYFPTRFADLTYRVDLQPADIASFYPRCINAPALMGLTSCDAGYSATRFQRDSFPPRWRDRIQVHFDGIDTDLYTPIRNPSRRIGDVTLAPDTKVVTFVSRGLESMRGFDLFARLAALLSRERSNVLFVVAGDDRTYYGWDQQQIPDASVKDWSLRESGADPSRFLFLGHVEPHVLADVLAISDLHIYPSVPFVLSWSMVGAMASGRVVIGSDTAPVRELIDPGVHGLVAPLFDLDSWFDQARSVLADPASFSPLGAAARDRILESYSIDACIPRLREFFERVASSS